MDRGKGRDAEGSGRKPPDEIGVAEMGVYQVRNARTQVTAGRPYGGRADARDRHANRLDPEPTEAGGRRTSE
jgi:hypothetical protein